MVLDQPKYNPILAVPSSAKTSSVRRGFGLFLMCAFEYSTGIGPHQSLHRSFRWSPWIFNPCLSSFVFFLKWGSFQAKTRAKFHKGNWVLGFLPIISWGSGRELQPRWHSSLNLLKLQLWTSIEGFYLFTHMIESLIHHRISPCLLPAQSKTAFAALQLGVKLTFLNLPFVDVGANLISDWTSPCVPKELRLPAFPILNWRWRELASFYVNTV